MGIAVKGGRRIRIRVAQKIYHAAGVCILNRMRGNKFFLTHSLSWKDRTTIAAGATRGKRKHNNTHPEAENLINAVICIEGWREIPAKNNLSPEPSGSQSKNWQVKQPMVWEMRQLNPPLKRRAMDVVAWRSGQVERSVLRKCNLSLVQCKSLPVAWDPSIPPRQDQF